MTKYNGRSTIRSRIQVHNTSVSAAPPKTIEDIMAVSAVAPAAKHTSTAPVAKLSFLKSPPRYFPRMERDKVPPSLFVQCQKLEVPEKNHKEVGKKSNLKLISFNVHSHM